MASPYDSLFRAAQSKYGIPSPVLQGLVSVESGGNVKAVSPTGAFGLTQFEPPTAKTYGVKANDPTSEIMGAAHYLKDLGFLSNPHLALSKYNAGPGNPGAAGNYADKVLAAAKAAAGGKLDLSGLSAAPRLTSSSSLPQMPGAVATTAPSILDVLSGLNQGRTNVTGATDPLSQNIQNNWDLMAGLFKQNQIDMPSSSSTSGGPLPSSNPNVLHSGPAHLLKNGSLGGFLPQGAPLTLGRVDAGQDAQTKPGGPIVAPGAGQVIAVHSDPGGFGPSYPVVHFTSGPLAGKDVYLGHTYAALPVGAKFSQGQVLSHTGTHGVGNATVPGWVEIGFASALGQGNQGQGKAIAPLLTR